MSNPNVQAFYDAWSAMLNDPVYQRRMRDEAIAWSEKEYGNCPFFYHFLKERHLPAVVPT